MKKGRLTKRKKKRAINPTQDSFVLGTRNFAQISSVEGLILTRAMRTRIKQFDRDGISAEERRTEIIRVHRKRG